MQVKRTGRHHRVLTVLADHSDALKDAAALVTAIGTYQNLVLNADKEISRHDSLVRVTSVDKLQERELCATLTHEVSTAIEALAFAARENSLKQKAHYSNSTLKNLSYDEFAVVGRNVLSQALELRERLVPDYLPDETLAALSSSLQLLDAVVHRSGKIAQEIKISNNNVNLRLKECDLFLSAQLDMLMEPFRRKDPDFYLNYHLARKLGITNKRRNKAGTGETGVA